MHTALPTAAGEALRALLPADADPHTTIDLAARTAFLVRDRDALPEITAMVRADADRAAALIVTLAAMVDVDARPSAMLGWLAPDDDHDSDTARTVGALQEARREMAALAGDALVPVTAESIALITACQADHPDPDVVFPVTLETMRALSHAARAAGILQPCGTTGGYARHLTRKEAPCARCTKASNLYTHATPEQKALLKTPPLVAVECGTLAGFDAHRTAGTAPCAGCLAAAQLVVGIAPPAVECGTVTGFDAHIKAGKKPCRACLAAGREALKEIPPSCGTVAGYDVHIKAGKKPCTRCAAAVAKFTPLPPKQRERCGERAGYVAHKRAGEKACDPCEEALRRYALELYDKRRERQGKPRLDRPETTGGTVHQLPVPIGEAIGALLGDLVGSHDQVA
jgi:hypothetical protein